MYVSTILVHISAIIVQYYLKNMWKNLNIVKSFRIQKYISLCILDDFYLTYLMKFKGAG